MKTNKYIHSFLKNIPYAVLLIIAMLVSCTEDDPKVEDQIIGSWNLIQVSGGILGLDCMFDEGDVTWTFSTSSITIEADNLSISLCPVIDNQEHTYTILYTEEIPFLIRDNQEFGQVSITESLVNDVTTENLSIDGTVYSTGQIDDGFVFSFVRTK